MTNDTFAGRLLSKEDAEKLIELWGRGFTNQQMKLRLDGKKFVVTELFFIPKKSLIPVAQFHVVGESECIVDRFCYIH